MTSIGEFLQSAGAFDSNGQIRVERVQGTTGQWFQVAVDADGTPVTFWGAPDARFADEKSFRDGRGNVLMSIAVMYDGNTLVTPVDASLRPTISVASLVTSDGARSANPGGWPLTREELEQIDRGEPPAMSRDVPEWVRRLLEGVATDELGRPLTTRVKATDGLWTDVLMMENGEPQRLEVDFEMMESGKPGGHLKAATTVRVGKTLVVVELDAEGCPIVRRASPQSP